MEPKQMFMLGVLLAVAIVGSAYIIYVLQTIDNDDDKENGDNDHGHGGH